VAARESNDLPQHYGRLGHFRGESRKRMRKGTAFNKENGVGIGRDRKDGDWEWNGDWNGDWNWKAYDSMICLQSSSLGSTSHSATSPP
jgi:hypothetical protein